MGQDVLLFPPYATFVVQLDIESPPLHYYELLHSFTDYAHILLMELRMTIKQLRLLFVHLSSSQNVYLTKVLIFTAELEFALYKEY